MKVWILNVGENMPTDGDGTRIFRCGLLADQLVKKGHEITWWTSSFEHYNKKHRYEKDETIIINDRYSIKFLKGLGYKSNVSVRRILDHLILGQKFIKNAKKEEQPDIIITSFPIISFTYWAVKYGLKKNIPVIIDARDMWPDIFIEAFPNSLKHIGKLLMYPVTYFANYSFKNAFAITGMTDGFVNWGLSKTDRKRNKFDTAFPFGYSKKEFYRENLSEAEKFWEEKALSFKDNIITVISNVAGVFNIDLVVSAAKKAKEAGIDVKIVICGLGEKFNEIEEKSRHLDNIVLAGWVDGAKIHALMRISKAGWIPYENRKDFLMSIPNKVPEYMSQGLPVITSLDGVVRDVVEKNNCGYFIENEEDFCEAINLITQQKEDYETKRQNSLRYFSENFDSDKVYSNMAEYLENIVSFKKGK